MRVSTVMTVRDGERYLAEALTSVLAQTRPPDQVVVVDDGSTDGTLDVLDTFDVTVLRQPPSGIAAGLNRGVAAADGDVLTFLDADDLWEPDAVAVRLEGFRSDVVGGATAAFASPELPADVAARFVVDPVPVHGALLGALALPGDAFRRWGSFDETVRGAPAVDWVARARTHGMAVRWVEPVVLRRRIHPASTSVTTRGGYEAMLEVARRQHRRRSAG